MALNPKKRPRNSTALPKSAPPAKLQASRMPALKFPHEAFNSQRMAAGQGQKFHEFSSFSLTSSADRDKYVKDTGLKQVSTTQNWGTPSASPSAAPLEAPRMYRSRRGSISGLAPMPDGSVGGWRLHSLPTSEALRNQDVSDSTEFADAYSKRAKILTKPILNSRNKEQTVNAVLSDFGKVRYDTSQNAFQFTDVTHAMGVSGKGMNNKTSSPPEEIYAPSISVSKDDGKSGTPAQTYHSEPMAITLHNGARTTKLEDESGMVGIFASYPNQVCFQCGRMFQEKIGKDAVVTGVPGRPFGGQVEGDTFMPLSKTTVSRAAPMTELHANSTNASEVTSIYEHHKRTHAIAMSD